MADSDSRAGATYRRPEVITFCDQTHAPHDAALHAAFHASETHGLPAIHVSANEGKFLEFLVRLIDARNIVEIGTLAGYSAIRMARAMSGGRLVSLELDARHAAVARENIAKATLQAEVEIRQGDAQQSLEALSGEGPFDLIFIDADKQSYASYGRWARAHLRPGGLLVADNVYLFGKLMEDSARGEAMRAFHRECAAEMESVCVPTPDGMLIAQKPR